MNPIRGVLIYLLGLRSYQSRGKILTGIIAIDLEHIPRGDEAQNRLRQYFQYVRAKSESKNATKSKEEALREAIEKVRAEFPDFEPKFDRSYFSMSCPSTEPKAKEEDSSVTSTEIECVLISLCACGVPCRYHGQTHKMGQRLIKEKKLSELKSKYNVIPVCPEIMGGLPTPRCACQVKWSDEEPSVTNRKTGEKEFMSVDLTEAYKRGAEWTLWMAKLFNCKKAYLLKQSPACDPKDGVAARLLNLNGIHVVGL
jgi:uncharacterized protein YbbK (DUF523 family)